VSAQEYVLWGSHPSYADGVPIRLTGGTVRECRTEKRWRESDGGWTLSIRKAGELSGLATPGACDCSGLWGCECGRVSS
jgi:hypothetical protein